MSQQKKLEMVLDILLSENADQADEYLHQIIVEKARAIYESIVDEESDEEDKDELDEAEDTIGGEPNKDFTKEIADDELEIDSDEESGGEAEGDDEEDDADDSDEEDDSEDNPFDTDDSDEGSTEDRVEDLESQLAELRAEFDALMGEEMQEPNHADLAGVDPDVDDEGADIGDEGGMDAGTSGFGGGDQVVGEVVATMYEKKKSAKLEKAPEAKDKKKDKKVDEETKFLQSVGDTGQKGTARLVGTGKNSQLGAEQDKSPYTSIPLRKDYGGKPVKIGGNGGTGGEYGKYNGDTATNKTPTDNVGLKQKSVGIKADTTPKFTGGKVAGPGFTKSPLTKKPS